ncbi:helix-turn-helix domain-containing protein [Granulicella tundricola]|uniref:Helix-turn-helix domain protein n=1 Tax=Granulicella tundricola (strain ATCC BAA-1859 / DSM 23138 / MP5ACTX9) TaxID=1198114 RepID=E8X2I5_GRATM|nr:helix-turn-helix transcriptional regulator [Granulicella tundricola]ADW69209.1 helix-turn-helix domain protein [Granulicella tundricola MP5ACTX9]
MVVAKIIGEMLTWARTCAGLKIESLAEGSISVEMLTAWEDGTDKPSQTQAIAIAEKLGISYAMLFMPEVPPSDNPNTLDLRVSTFC